MKANEIKVGGLYTAKVSGKLTTVRVDTVRDTYVGGGHTSRGYDVTNIATGRKTTFRSAAKFRGVAETPEQRQEQLNAMLAVQDAKTLAMPEAAGLTPDMVQHAAGTAGYLPNPVNPTSVKCYCTRCRIIRAMQRQAERLAAENPYREGW